SLTAGKDGVAAATGPCSCCELPGKVLPNMRDLLMLAEPLIDEWRAQRAQNCPIPTSASQQEVNLHRTAEFAATIACFHSSSIVASFEARKRVPRFTPTAPSISAAAMPRPSNIPPEATTGMGETAST